MRPSNAILQQLIADVREVRATCDPVVDAKTIEVLDKLIEDLRSYVVPAEIEAQLCD